MAKLEMSSLNKALDSLGRSLAITNNSEKMAAMDDDLAETVRAGVIQNFEVCYELCWKFMKRWLEANVGKSHVEGVPCHELFRLGAENKLIDDVEEWMSFHKLRNETSHTYDVATAENVFNIANSFYKASMVFYKNIEAKND